jgi:hypothetical protein
MESRRKIKRRGFIKEAVSFMENDTAGTRNHYSIRPAARKTLKKEKRDC